MLNFLVEEIQQRQSGKLEEFSFSRIMEEEFQGGVCGGSWWNSSRNLFSSSPCSAAVNDLGTSAGWLNPSLIVDDMKTAKSLSDDSAGSSDGGSSVVLQEAQKPQLRHMPIDSTLQMMMTGDDWNQDLLHDSARSQENYSHMLQALNSSMNCRPKIADEEWTTSDFSADSSTNSFKHVYQSLLLPSNSFTQCAATPPPPASGTFPLNTASYGLLQTLFDTDSDQPHQALLDTPNFGMNSTGLASSMMKPSLFPKQQLANNFQFVNNTPFWNATAPGEVRASFLPSSTPQLMIPSALTKARPNQPNFSSKHHNHEKAGEAESVAKKGGNEPSFKRPRIETPSPLPTFKVRKEKLGDRVTALQQLVSPFGKTDTASVLHEAIEYIKLLHDQVTVLSTPYLKNGQPPLQRQQLQGLDKINDQEEPMKDLRSRGLCLVPISSTFPVATETTADFWTPTFGGSFSWRKS